MPVLRNDQHTEILVKKQVSEIMNLTDQKIEKGIQIEHPDLSQITGYLYLSSMPKSEYKDHILSLGIHMIISMPVNRPPKVYRRSPFKYVHYPSLDSRWAPIPMFLLRRGVSAALPMIEEDKAVLVHCKEGIHRSVAMACCILIAKGCSAEEAMHLVSEKRSKADPYVPYIRKRIEKFESNWRNNHV